MPGKYDFFSCEFFNGSRVKVLAHPSEISRQLKKKALAFVQVFAPDIRFKQKSFLGLSAPRVDINRKEIKCTERTE